MAKLLLTSSVSGTPAAWPSLLLGVGAVLYSVSSGSYWSSLLCPVLPGWSVGTPLLPLLLVLGGALDWFDVLGYKVVEEKATDYAHLKQALTEQFPVVRNRSKFETRFYASYHNHNQRPSEFVYELLKIHKHLKLGMAEEKLINHIISRLEPQLLYYVEVRHPQTTSSLLQLIDKYEEMCF
ncbi:uncharacterized protein TNCV_1498811 [Trichonephila clavipes]|nr:uncharacterized protein TNCV_1498811 [Trichonephila clavipes]